MPEIVVRNAALSFPAPGGEAAKIVYDGLDLNIASGSFTVILGPSGCGKSTLLNVINGLLTPTSADEVSIDGKDIREHPELARKMAYVFQDPRLLPWKTLRDNVVFGLAGLRVKPRSEWNDLMQRYFKMAGLEDYVNYYPRQLSGGMQQRASIVRAWVNEPEVLLMDEPFSDLDEITAAELRRELVRMWSAEEARRTVVFVTHNLRETALLASDVAVLTQAPAKVCHLTHVDLDWPRDPRDERVFNLETELRTALESKAGVLT